MLVHVTVSPALMVIDEGKNPEGLALTAMVFAETVRLTAAAFVFAELVPLAAGAVFVAALTEALVLVVVAVFFEHAAPVSTSVAAAKRRPAESRLFIG